MTRIRLTRAIAWALATDAANDSMRAGGRDVWSDRDYSVAVHTFNTLWPHD